MLSGSGLSCLSCRGNSVIDHFGILLFYISMFFLRFSFLIERTAFSLSFSHFSLLTSFRSTSFLAVRIFISSAAEEAKLLPCLTLFSLRRIAAAAVIAFSSITRSPLALVLSFFASSGCRLNVSYNFVGFKLFALQYSEIEMY